MVIRDNDKIIVQGPITIINVVEILEQGISLFDRNDLIIDLAQVTDIDSSAVSMLFEWKRRAQKNNQQVYFSNIPENLKNLSQLYGVAELIPLVQH
ncbi:MAG: anti-anti-sigma factor [Nitrosomonadaceae bacterium]|nr:anti-anti-sigma factor [Nitrosomonadaceae bacterium]|tara:strand:+ start:1554 stop:1841 length:288 start_codon:yes stop_codon:yes gene_type:complete